MITKAITGRANDLARIAAFAYAADQAVSRGGVRDVHDERWQRTMMLCVPVGDASFWSQDKVYKALQRTLNFATDDHWHFGFTRGSGPLQLPLGAGEHSDAQPAQRPDHVALLSGGADSLCAAVDAIRRGRRPLIVSHRPSPAHDSRQRLLGDALAQKFDLWPLSRTRFPIHLVGWEPKESTQRTRAFLYASLGAALAHEAGLEEVSFADNGVVSINLPLNASVQGAMASRSTHPRFIERFNELAALVLPCVRVVNSLLPSTRADALSVLKDAGHPDLLALTNSCSRVRSTKRGAPHCGYCSQCVDRRFGAIRAGLEAYDPPGAYALDIFTRHLKQGDQRTIPYSYVNRARRIDKLDDDGLFGEYAQLDECLPDDSWLTDRAAGELIALLRRHADDVREVVRTMMDRHWNGLWLDDVEEQSLLRLVCGTAASSTAAASTEATEQRAPASGVARARASGDHVFRREGDGWRVVYGGQDAYVKHSEGMRYIAYLLASRDQEIGAVDLRRRFGPAESAAGGVSIDSDQAKSEGLSESGAERYDHIDDTARRQIRARRVEIDGERPRLASEATTSPWPSSTRKPSNWTSTSGPPVALQAGRGIFRLTKSGRPTRCEPQFGAPGTRSGTTTLSWRAI